MKNIASELIDKFLTNLRKKRKKAFTQQEFADQMEVGQSYIAQIESGEKLPSLDFFKQMIEKLDLDEEEAMVYYNFRKAELNAAPTGSTVSLNTGGQIIISPKKPKKPKK